MRKILFVAAIISIFGVQFSTCHAQVGTDFGVNMFASLKGGVGVFSNRMIDSQTGFSGGLSVGKWIVNPLAFRASFDLMDIPVQSGDKGNYRFALFNAEFLWDFTATFFRIRHHRWYVPDFYPMMGLGMSFRQLASGESTDREFQVMLGAQLNWRISKGWDIFLEYNCNFYSEALAQGNGVYLHSGLLGFSRQFTESPFRRRTEHESRDVFEDWFFGLGMGPNFSSFTFEHVDKLDMYGIAPEIMFGRNCSNFWTIRFELTGLTAHGPYDTINEQAGDGYTFGMLHSDVMLNLTHAIKFTRGKKLNVLPYLGAGMVWRFDKPQFDMGADFGVMLRYYIGRRSDLYADFKYLMVPPRIGGGIGPEGPLPGIFGYNVVWVGLPSITLGYIYNFGTNTTRYRLPAHWCAD